MQHDDDDALLTTDELNDLNELVQLGLIRLVAIVDGEPWYQIVESSQSSAADWRVSKSLKHPRS
jgi:hypothetical protein